MYYNHKVKKKLKKDIYWSEMNKYWKISFYKPVRENKFLGISFIQNIVFEKKKVTVYIKWLVLAYRLLIILNHQAEYLLYMISICLLQHLLMQHWIPPSYNSQLLTSPVNVQRKSKSGREDHLNIQTPQLIKLLRISTNPLIL